jgi:trimethylamine--corrinoid protein Co-methyltransferase
MKMGPKGELLNVLAPGEIARIHESSQRLLEEHGVRCDSEALRQVLARGGARIAPDGRTARIPRALVEWALRSAPRSFVFCGRDPAYDLLVEPPRVYYGLGGSPVPFCWDRDAQAVRPAVEADVATATRVGHALPHVDFVMSLASAGDAPEAIHYLREYRAILTNTTKPVIYSAPDRASAAAFLEMAAIASGGEAQFARRPSVMLFTQPVSPLQVASYNEGMMEFAAAGAPILYSPGAMMGATSPATLAGALVQGNAETLVGVVLSQLFRPGTPIVYGPHTPVMDMRTARCTYAGTEQALGRAAMAQLARHLGLPSFSTGAGSDANVADLQAGAEATMGIFLNGLAGLTLTQTMGTMGGGIFGSLEMLVICDEIVGMAKRVLRGIEVTEETLAEEVIAAVGPGGHFLDQAHTAQTYRREFFFPALFSRLGLEEWQGSGQQRAEAAARARLEELLRPRAPALLPAAAEQALEDCVARHASRVGLHA